MRVRWLVGEASIDSDFSRARNDLRPMAASDTNGFEVPREWQSLFLFEEQDYAEGGGAAPFLGVHGDTRQVFALDVESEDFPLSLLNSDMDKFLATFDVLDRAVRRGTIQIEQASRLAEETDPEAFADSGWAGLIDAITSEQMPSLRA